MGLGAVHTEAGDPADVVKLIGVDEPRDPGPGQVLVGVTLFPIHRGDHGPFYRVDVTDLTGTETALPRAVDDLGSLCVTHTHHPDRCGWRRFIDSIYRRESRQELRYLT